MNKLVELNNAAYKMPLKDGSLYELSDNDLIMFKQVYTAIDVDFELRKMIAWLVSNPSKRKTKRGIMKFINGWFGRAKPEGPQTSRGYARKTSPKDELNDNSWARQSQRDYIKNTTIEERLNDTSWAD